jgi:hypothetical protein
VIVKRTAHHVMLKDRARRGPHRIDKFAKRSTCPSERAAEQIAVKECERSGAHRRTRLRV